MVFKIFNKIKKNGVMVPGGDEYTNAFYEADQINITPPKKGSHIAYYKIILNDSQDPSSPEVIEGEIDLDYRGYELYNSNGVILERYITSANMSID